MPIIMDTEKLKLIVRNLKSLVDVLESEIYSDVESYTKGSSISPHLLITMRSLKMTNEDWRYSEDKLKLRGECLHILLNKFSYDDPNKVNYTTQDIYECAHDWVSQGNKISSGIVAYFEASLLCKQGGHRTLCMKN